MIRLALLWLCLALSACGEPAPPPAPAGAARPLDDAALRAVESAMEATATIGSLLAADQLSGLAEPAAAVDGALEPLAEAHEDAELQAISAQARTAARALPKAADLTEARRHFGTLNEALFALAAGDPRLQAGWQSYRCPMVDHFPKWFQKDPDMANPYMGQAMLTCGSHEDWGAPGSWASEAPAASTTDEVAHWTCPMHPSVRSPEPGACPMCAMDLVPVSRAAIDSGEVLVDGPRRQALGIRTAVLAEGALGTTLEAAGTVAVDEARQRVLTARVGGFVERLRVRETGALVRTGQPVLDLYSPELLTTQQDLLRAHHSGAPTAHLEDRLRRWGLKSHQIRQIIEGGSPWERVPLLAESGGVVLDKPVIEGAAVKPGEVLLRLADLSRVWVEAQVFPEDLGRLTVGLPATVRGPDGVERAGTVHRVLPELDDQTRSSRVIVALDNPENALQPGMYADVRFPLEQGRALMLPREAALFAGPRTVVFVDRGEDRLQPVDVELGPLQGDHYPVRSGLSAGAQVVVSGNFLIAAESRLQAATGFWARSAAEGHDHAH